MTELPKTLLYLRAKLILTHIAFWLGLAGYAIILYANWKIALGIFLLNCAARLDGYLR